MTRLGLAHHIALRTVTALLLPSALLDCRSRAADASASETPPRELLVTTADFAFDAPDTIESGWVRVRLLNRGSEPHHVQLVRLRDGHTVQQLLDQMKEGNVAPSWALFVGGPNVPKPGSTSEVAVELAPGNYAMLCFIRSSDHVSHLAKGMTRLLTVIPTTRPQGREPAVDGRLILNDYSFSLTTELRSGRQTIRVENAGPQPHEVVFFRLLPGKTTAEALAWARKRMGRPPFEFAGGTLALSPGGENFLTLDLVPGNYVLVCFVPDVDDGKPHLAHGMIRELAVN